MSNVKVQGPKEIQISKSRKQSGNTLSCHPGESRNPVFFEFFDMDFLIFESFDIPLTFEL